MALDASMDRSELVAAEKPAPAGQVEGDGEALGVLEENSDRLV